MEAPAQLVVEAGAQHGFTDSFGHLQRSLGLRPGVVPQQKFNHHARRKLGVATSEPATHRVILPSKPQQCLGKLFLARQLAGPVLQLACRQVASDLPRDFTDFFTSAAPRALNPLQHLPEGRHAMPRLGREVRAEVKGFAVRRHEDRHGPAALPRRRLHGLHVHGVHVRAFLAVDLDVHEVLVHVRRRGLVLERFVCQNMTPVASAVSHTQEDGHVALAGLLEGGRLPLPPVDGVVRVLQEIRGRGVYESVGHTSILAHAPKHRLRATGTHTDAGRQLRHPEASAGGIGAALRLPLRAAADSRAARLPRQRESLPAQRMCAPNQSPARTVMPAFPMYPPVGRPRSRTR